MSEIEDAYRQVLRAYIEAVLRACRLYEGIHYANGRELPWRSDVHAAYRAKTRRRNRRRR